MNNQDNATTVCGLPDWVAFPANDSTSYINDAVAVGVNVPLGIFAFLSNLVIIVTVAKTPNLQRPSNILLCSLAAIDCLVGLTSQPLFFIWRLMLHRARKSCYLQTELFELRYVLNTLTLGGAFAIFTLISFDRARALSNPLRYRTEVTNKGMLIITCWYQVDETGLTILKSMEQHAVENIFWVNWPRLMDTDFRWQFSNPQRSWRQRCNENMFKYKV